MAIWEPDNRGFFERNAGKLLIWAFAAGIPLRMAGMAFGIPPMFWLADILFAVLLFSAIGGYIARRSTRSEEKRRQSQARDEDSNLTTVSERNEMMNRITKQ